MPLRMVIILIGLFAACAAFAAMAWLSGAEIFLFIPGRRHAHRPPTHPAIVLAGLAFCLALFVMFSEHYGLVCFTVLAGCIVLGTILGYPVFSWTPTPAQWLLTIAAGTEAIYGWTKHNTYFDY